MATAPGTKFQWGLAAAAAALVACGALLVGIACQPDGTSVALSTDLEQTSKSDALQAAPVAAAKPPDTVPAPRPKDDDAPKPVAKSRLPASAGPVRVVRLVRRAEQPMPSVAKTSVAKPPVVAAAPSSERAVAQVTAQQPTAQQLPAPKPAPVDLIPTAPPASNPFMMPAANAPLAPAQQLGADTDLPAPIQPLNQPSTADLPRGITVNRDGGVFIGYKSVQAALDKTNQFPAVDPGARRYIYGRHVYVISQDLLHGGSLAVDQWQNYTMGDEDAAPASTDGTLPSGAAFMVHHQGTVAGVTDLPVRSLGNAALAASAPVHVVPSATAQAIATAIQTTTSDPQQFIQPQTLAFDPPMMSAWGAVSTWGGFGPTTPQCWSVPRTHYYHRFYRTPVGYGSYARPLGYQGYSYPQACLALVSEDAILTAVAIDYRGHSTPTEVIGDLEGARDTLAGQTVGGDDDAVQRTLVTVYDAEIRLWQAVATANTTAKAAAKAWAAGNVDQCLALCRQFQAQVAPYHGTSQYDLFLRDHEQIQQLAARAGADRPAANG